jgi:hypothetical protein
MISLNLSPETKIGRVEKDGDKVKIHHVSGRLFEMTPENFKKFINEEQFRYKIVYLYIYEFFFT